MGFWGFWVFGDPLSGKGRVDKKGLYIPIKLIKLIKHIYNLLKSLEIFLFWIINHP